MSRVLSAWRRHVLLGLGDRLFSGRRLVDRLLVDVGDRLLPGQRVALLGLNARVAELGGRVGSLEAYRERTAEYLVELQDSGGVLSFRLRQLEKFVEKNELLARIVALEAKLHEEGTS